MIRHRAVCSLPAFVCVLSLLLLPGATGAQEEEDPAEGWSPALTMKYLPVAGLDLSDDASLVAYVIREPLMKGEKSEFLSHIWVVPASGESPRQFTRGEHTASSPAFSPDGRFLAFLTDRSGKNQVWVMPVDGGEAAQVTDGKSGVGSFQWSPDGASIVYTMADPETEEEEKAKEEKRDVILVDQNFKYNHLYTVPFSFGAREVPEAKRLTEGDFNVTSFDWAPNGESVVFAHAPDPRLNNIFMAGDISVVDLESGSIRSLVDGAGTERSPAVSPDGRWVAYSSSGDRPEPVGLGDVYVVPFEGGVPRQLAATHDQDANILGWSGDGTHVLFMEPMGTTTQLMALPVDGGPPEPVTSGQGVFGNLSLDGNASHMAFTFEDSETPWEVFVSAVEPFSMNRLTDLHADVPRPPMGRTELLQWESKDGRFQIEGLLTYPVDYEDGRRYPLILSVHGGPGGVYSQSFSGGPGIYMNQYFAQKGYAILRPNPRGSRGYGKEFRFANVRDWGFGDMDDLMEGVDHVIDMGVAHADSLLLMGWSYGGYMTSFAVTRTNRFKAASMGAGLPNLVSMTTTTDIQDYLVAHLGGVEFWDDYEEYERHSAIYRIANVTTPTQVIHGAQDLRVPFTQGQEFYRALGRRGVPTEMVVYPRTPHGPREPKFLMDVSERILLWFEKHLGRE